MSKGSDRRANRPQPSSRRAAVDFINEAFKKSDVAEICHAIGGATRLYSISDIAKVSGLERTSIYRAFEGDTTHPNFKTVLSVLDAMGFQLHVKVRRSPGPARLKSVEIAKR
jgi:probable addiction module antidote protein